MPYLWRPPFTSFKENSYELQDNNISETEEHQIDVRRSRCSEECERAKSSAKRMLFFSVHVSALSLTSNEMGYHHHISDRLTALSQINEATLFLLPLQSKLFF